MVFVERCSRRAMCALLQPSTRDAAIRRRRNQ
jgi:hypothetical protein